MQTARVCNHAAACGSDCDCYPSRGTSAHAALRIRTRPPWRNASARANACGGKTVDGAMRHMTGLTAFMSGGGNSPDICDTQQTFSTGSAEARQ